MFRDRTSLDDGTFLQTGSDSRSISSSIRALIDRSIGHLAGLTTVDRETTYMSRSPCAGVQETTSPQAESDPGQGVRWRFLTVLGTGAESPVQVRFKVKVCGGRGGSHLSGPR